MKLSFAHIIIFFVISLNSFAQTDVRAKAILDEVSKKYQSFNIVKANFEYTINNPKAKIKDIQTGTLLILSKSNKYKVTLKGQELICDGKNQWTYLKSDKEVQISEVNNSPEALNPAKMFTIYEKGFKYLYTGDSKINNKVYHMIDLVPLDDKRAFFKVRLQIEKNNKLISSALIFNKDGNRYTYSIKSFTPNVQVDESTFTFDPKKYPGVEVVDLR